MHDIDPGRMISLRAEIQNNQLPLKKDISADWRERVYALLLLSGLILIILLPWHASNHHIPIWDEASFVGTVEEMLASFRDGVWAGLKAAYLVRDWRPIIFPTIATPFFALAHGDILLGICFTACFSFGLVGIYSFLLLQNLMSYSRALIGSTFVITTPWILNFGYRFFSEMFWLAAASAFLFHLITGLSRGPRVHLLLAGLWLGIMGATRPAETVIVATLPALFLLVSELRRGKITLLDIGVLLLQAGLLGLAIWQLIQAGFINLPVILLLLGYLLLTGVWARRLFAQAPILGLIVIAECVFMAWHIVSMRELYAWSYETSFGPMAKLPYGSFKGASPLPLLRAFSANFNIGFLALIGLVDVVVLVATRSKSKFDEDTVQALKIVVIAVLMLTPILAMLWITNTMDMRRPMAGMLVLYIGVVAVALLPKILWPRIRFALLLVVTALQFGTATANAINLQSQATTKLQSTFGFLMPPSTGADANAAMMDRLISLGVSSGRLALYSLCYRDLVAKCSERGFPVVEVQALTALARERNLDFYLNFPLDLDFSKPETLAAQLNERGYAFVLVDMFDNPDQVVNADAVFGHTFQFMSLVQQGLPPGFADIAQFTLGGRQFHLLSVKSETTAGTHATK